MTKLCLGETTKLCGCLTRQKHIPVLQNFVPRFQLWRIVLREQEMQSGRIPLRRKTCPLPQRVEAHVNVVRPIAALIASATPDMELLLLQPEHEFWRFQVNSVNVQIIRVLYFRAVQFAAAHEQVDEAIEVRKLG